MVTLLSASRDKTMRFTAVQARNHRVARLKCFTCYNRKQLNELSDRPGCSTDPDHNIPNISSLRKTAMLDQELETK